MEVTLLGTANPCPQPDRAGTSIAVSTDEETFLIDCGQWATYRMVEHDVDFVDIETVFFTHQHVDHNASFFHFAFAGWYFGRENLTVYGPDGTRQFVDGLLTAYEKPLEDIARWRHVPIEGITDIEIHDVDDDFEAAGPDWEISAMPVDHSHYLDVYAYRVEEPSTGGSFVFSADTTRLDSMVEFAQGADILVHECNIVDPNETPIESADPDSRYLRAPFEEYIRWAYESNTQDDLGDVLHTSPADAAAIAQEAGVDTLVLTHLNALRETEKIRAAAEAEFDGQVVVAEDGLTLST